MISIIFLWEHNSAAKLYNVFKDSHKKVFITKDNGDSLSILQSIKTQQVNSTYNECILIVCFNIIEWIEFTQVNPNFVYCYYIRPTLFDFGSALLELQHEENFVNLFYRRAAMRTDRILSAHKLLSLEQFYFTPEIVSSVMRSTFGITLSTDEFLVSEKEYKDSLSALLRDWDKSIFDALGCDLRIETGRRYRTAGHERGVFLLGSGWSHPEGEYTWSQGLVSKICLPLFENETCFTSSNIWLRIKGIMYCSTLTVLSSGTIVGSYSPSNEIERNVCLDIMLTEQMVEQYGHGIELDFQFSSTICPHLVTGSPDQRNLSFALTEIQIIEERRSGELNFLRKKLKQIKAKTVALYGSSEESLTSIYKILISINAISLILVNNKKYDHKEFNNNKGIININEKLRLFNLYQIIEIITTIDAFIVWEESLLVTTFQALRSSVLPTLNRYPSIFVRIRDPDLFNKAWWSDRQAFEFSIYVSDVTIEQGWACIRLRSDL